VSLGGYHEKAERVKYANEKEAHRVTAEDNLKTRYVKRNGDGSTLMETEDKRMKERTIDRAMFKAFLEEDVRVEEDCMSLPSALIFLFSFFGWFAIHHQTTLAYQMQYGVVREVENGMGFFDGGHLSFYDITGTADWWQWFEEGMFPRVWKRHDYVGDLLPPALWGRFLEYNQIMGGIRIIQERNEEHVCDGSAMDLAPFYGKLCYLSKGTEKILTKPYGPAKCSIALELSEDEEGSATSSALAEEELANLCQQQAAESRPDPWEDVAAFYPKEVDGSEFVVVLDSISSPDDIWAKYQYLKNNQWIDDATVNIKIRFDLWNPEIRHGGWMCSTLMVFSMQPGGLVYSTITSVAFPAFPYLHTETVIIDAFFVFVLAKMAFREGKQIIEACKDGTLVDYFQFWNIIDIVCVLVSNMIFIFWILQTLTLGTAGSQILEAYELEQQNVYGEGNDIRDFDIGTPGNYTLGVRRLHDKDIYAKWDEVFTTMDGAVSTNGMMKFFMFLYSFVLIFRFFKAFSAQPRLAVVANTLFFAGSDLAHLFFVLFTIFFAFALAASIMFGHELKSFSGPANSALECFAILLGAFDFPAMMLVDPLAWVWFWSYEIILFLVLLNMLLAIVMDAYATVKGADPTAMEMWRQAMDLVRRHRETQAQMRLDLSHILSWWNNTFDEDEEDVMKVVVTVKSLLEVKNLPEKQAKRLLDRALKFKDTREKKGDMSRWSLSTACHALRLLGEKFDLLVESQEDVLLWQKDMLDMMKKPDTAPAPGSTSISTQPTSWVDHAPATHDPVEAARAEVKNAETPVHVDDGAGVGVGDAPLALEDVAVNTLAEARPGTAR
jgi:hypothetical protein